MTRDEILEMAYKAGFGNIVSMPHIDGFVRFANLVAQSERESCANLIAAGRRNIQTGGVVVCAIKDALDLAEQAIRERE